MHKKSFPLKTLFVLPALDVGGAERVLITLMNNVNRVRFDPEFLLVRDGGPLRDLVDPGIAVHSINQKPTPLILPFLPALYRKIKLLKPDVIVSTMTHMNFALLMLKPFFPDTVFIVREAITPSFLFQKYKRTHWIIKQFYRALYPRADLILSPTQTIFDEFSHDLGLDPQRFTLLKNPVDTRRIRAFVHEQESDGTFQDRVRFVACGRLREQKGFDRLIDALKSFHAPYHWQLDILGEGAERSYLEGLIKANGLEDRVFLKGTVIPPYINMARADCFLLPSRFEGLPNVVLESLACGTPVIASREAGGIGEIASDCAKGSVIIANDMDAFVKAMGGIKPQSKSTQSASLLAPCYEQDTVFEQFDQILFCENGALGRIEFKS